MDQRLVDRDLVRQGDGIEAARTDDKRSHRRAPCFDRVGCDRVGPTPTTHSYHRQTLNRPARGKRPKDGIIAVSHTRRPFQEGCQSRSLAPVAMSRPPQRRPTLERLAICRYPAYTMVTVGTAVASRPPYRSRRALLTHRAPPSGSGVEAVTRQRVYRSDWRKEAGDDLDEPLPAEACRLAASLQRREPDPLHLVDEPTQVR